MSTSGKNNRFPSTLLALALVFLVGCEVKSQPKQEGGITVQSIPVLSTTTPTGDAALFFESPFVDEQTKKPPFQLESIDTLERFAGKTIQIQRKPITNRYDDSVTDEQLFIESEKYSSYFYHVTTTDKYNLEYVHIDDNSYPLKNGVEFGMSKEDIESIFGEPDGINKHPKNYELYYVASDEGQVNFSFQDEKLTSIFLWNTAE